MVLGRSSIATVLVLSLAACGDDGATPIDAAIDTTPDSNIDAGPCGNDLLFTGEFVDWDSQVTDFCGIFAAKFTVRGDAARMSSTAPNGRFLLCVPNQTQTLVDIPPPLPSSGCPHITGTYPTRGLAVANQAVIAANGEHSLRGMTQTRLVSMYTTIGQAFNMNQAQLFVHVVGVQHPVTISTPNHSQTYKYDGAAWSLGDTGVAVFFPNVDVTAGPVQIDMAGGATGGGTVPLEAGTFTYVTLIGH